METNRRARIIARLEKLEAQLAALDDAIDNGILHVEMASLDTGEGKQVMKYKSFDQMERLQKSLERRIERYYNILDGVGIVNMNLRRKNDTEGFMRGVE